MGQAKHNPKSILKKQGLLKPKPKKPSAVERRESDIQLVDKVYGRGIIKLMAKVK